MAYTLKSFARACHAVLTEDPGPSGRVKLRALVEEALKDKAFVEANIRPDGPERKLLYEDPELGFVILAHSYRGAKDSSPHDHGPTWAIYGQASGETIMTDWECLARPTAREGGSARRIAEHVLKAGMADLCEIGVLHSPRREGPTRLLRIEGTDLAKLARKPYVAVPATAPN